MVVRRRPRLRPPLQVHHQPRRLRGSRVHPREREALRPRRPRHHRVPQPDVRSLQKPRLVDPVRLERGKPRRGRDAQEHPPGAPAPPPSAPPTTAPARTPPPPSSPSTTPSGPRRSTGRSPGRTPTPPAPRGTAPPPPAAAGAGTTSRNPAVAREQSLVPHRVETPPRGVQLRQDLPEESPLRGSARPRLPVPISPSATPVKASFTRTRPARTSSCRDPSKRTGVISTTALFLSPWNTVPARRATSCGRYPRERKRARRESAAPAAPSRPATRSSPPPPPPRDEGPGSPEDRTPPPRRAHLLPDHRVHERAAQGQRRGPRRPSGTRAPARTHAPSPRRSLQRPEAPRPQLERRRGRVAREDVERDRLGVPVLRAAWARRRPEPPPEPTTGTTSSPGRPHRRPGAVSRPRRHRRRHPGEAAPTPGHRRHRPVERRHRRRVHVLQTVVVAHARSRGPSRARSTPAPEARSRGPGSATTSDASTGRPPRGRGRRGSRDCPAPNPSATPASPSRPPGTAANDIRRHRRRLLRPEGQDEPARPHALVGLVVVLGPDPGARSRDARDAHLVESAGVIVPSRAPADVKRARVGRDGGGGGTGGDRRPVDVEGRGRGHSVPGARDVVPGSSADHVQRGESVVVVLLDGEAGVSRPGVRRGIGIVGADAELVVVRVSLSLSGDRAEIAAEVDEGVGTHPDPPLEGQARRRAGGKRCWRR